MLDAARFAPSGGNRQGWRVVVVRDRAVRERMAELVKPVMRRYVAETLAGEASYNGGGENRLQVAVARHHPEPFTSRSFSKIPQPSLLLL
jgi:nitroreductase